MTRKIKRESAHRLDLEKLSKILNDLQEKIGYKEDVVLRIYPEVDGEIWGDVIEEYTNSCGDYSYDKVFEFGSMSELVHWVNGPTT